MKTYNVAAIGFGGAAGMHNMVMSKGSRMKLTGTYDFDSSRATAIEAAGLHCYQSLEELLSDENVDIVLTTVPNHMHKEMCIKALEAGKNVICEKPLTTCYADFEAVMAAADANGKEVFVHHNRRWDMDFQKMNQLYHSGKLGEIYHVTSNIQSNGGKLSGWRAVKACGGGELLDCGVHYIDRVVWMVGEPVKSVYAFVKYLCGTDAEDTVRVYLTFESGKNASFEFSTLNFVPESTFCMYGLNGSAMIIKDKGPFSAVMRVVTRGEPDENGRPTTNSQDEEFPMSFEDWASFYENVADVLDGTAEPIITRAQMAQLMKIIDAVYESGRTGEVVHIC